MARVPVLGHRGTQSFGGKVANLIIQLLKPGSVAVLTAALTSKFFQLLNKKGSGMGQSTDKEHIVICGWSSKGEEIIKEIRGRDDDARFRPVVILAPLPSNPSRDTLTAFVRGEPTQETDRRRARIRRPTASSGDTPTRHRRRHGLAQL